MNKKCLFCNKSFIDFSYNKVKKYCNYVCKSKSRRVLDKIKLKKCFNCNKEFKDVTYNKNSKYCSKKCRGKINYKSRANKNYFTKYRKSEKYKNYQNKLKLEGKLYEYRKKYKKSYKYRIAIVKFKRTKKFLITHKTYQAFRRSVKLRAIPKWSDLNKIKEIYKNCPKGYHVDHIIPLQGKNVCGLHIENNLQYLTAEQNIAKGNKLINV